MISIECHWVLERCTCLIREEVTVNYTLSLILLLITEEEMEGPAPL